MNQQLLIFDVEDLLKMLTHYTQGEVPLDTRLLGFGASPFFQRMIGIEVESNQWNQENLTNVQADGLTPLNVRYEGKKILKLGKAGTQPEWLDAPDGRDKS